VVIGTELERMFGPGRFVAIYVVSGLLGSLASYALSSSLAAGASGAIFGLIGALAAFYLLHRERLGTWGRRRLANAVFLIAINLFFGFTQPGIDNWAHLGGLVGGFGLGWAMAPRYQVEPFAGRVVDRNRLARYAPALLLATAILVLGTAGATWIQRDSPRTHLLLGQEAVEDEAWAVAAEEIQQAIDRDPSLADASAYFYLGLAHNHLDELEAAAEAYESALALEPELEPAQWNLALTYLQLGRYDNARAGFESYLRLVPDAALEVQPYLDELDRLQSG
jgi:rhomboid protease GluP